MNVSCEQISVIPEVSRSLSSFWRMVMTNQSCKRQKLSPALPVAARWRSVRRGAKWATATTASELQFRQCRNSALSRPLLSPCYRRTTTRSPFPTLFTLLATSTKVLISTIVSFWLSNPNKRTFLLIII